MKRKVEGGVGAMGRVTSESEPAEGKESKQQ